MSEKIEKKFIKSSELILESIKLIPEIKIAIKFLIRALTSGKKVIIFGNGGSAADAQHIASELIGRFQISRKSLPAISLTTDSSVITSISNDFSFDDVFSRQCQALVSKGDVVIGISTSGNSKNVRNGLIVSKKRGAVIIGLLGNNGGSIKKVTDVAIIVKSQNTARIQEVHRVIYHTICEQVEKELSRKI